MSLKIIIFDGTFKTTPFINRLAQGLAASNQVYILGFNDSVKSRIEGVNYVALGNNQNKFRFLKTTIGWLFKGNSFAKTIKLLMDGNRNEIHKENLKSAIKTINPDLIHLQWPSVIPWFEEVLNEGKIPVVLSQRGYHINVRPFTNSENFEYLQKWFPKIAGFHSVSKAISEVGDAIFNSEEKIDSVVYTGLPIQTISLSKQYIRQEPIKLLSVGRANFIKGYDYALQTCKILKDKNVQFTYTIIGARGDEELLFLIDSFGLTEFVNLTDRKNQKEVYKIMAEASILLMPSLKEGLPNVIVEAMAIGLPVISTDCGGVDELITNNKNGIIVPIRNPKAMADAVLNFSKLSIEEVKKIRRSARKKVETDFTETLMIENMMKLYNNVLETKKIN